MYRSIALFGLLMFVTVSGRSVIAEVYTWTNADGSMGMTDDPAKIPEQHRKQAIQKQGADPENRVYQGRPADKGTAQSTEYRNAERGHDEYREPERRPEKKQMTEEEKKKLDAELRGKWNAMKKALSEGRL